MRHIKPAILGKPAISASVKVSEGAAPRVEIYFTLKAWVLVDFGLV